VIENEASQCRHRALDRVGIDAAYHQEVVPVFVELDVAVPHLRPAWW
jgi:hypothetical protein